MRPATGTAAAAALRATGDFARGARVLRRLHAAPVKSSWLVARGRERFVLRVDAPLAAALGLDRRGEHAVLRAAARAGLAPEPVFLDAAAPAVLVTRWAPGAAWGPRELADTRRLARLGALLRAVHEARLPARGQPLGDAIAGYAARAGTPAARALARQATAALAGGAAPVTCHRDPVAPNVVGLRATLLIDWEYAGPAEPLFDLAVVAGHHELRPAGVRALLAGWGGREGRGDWERLRALREAYRDLRRLWAMAVAAPAAPGRLRG